jgi:hypothetical protein
MPDTKHTPGPWRFARLEGSEELYRLQKREMPEHEGYFRENSGDWVVGFTSEHGQGRIAAVAFKGKAKRGQGWTAPDPEGMANARLIAAAPDLLEALKATLPLLEYPRHIMGHGSSCPGCEAMKIQKQVKAAIAKAEGVSQ